MKSKFVLKSVFVLAGLSLVSAGLSSPSSAGEIVGAVRAGQEHAGLVTVDYVKTESLKQVEKLGKTASESLGLETGETVSVFRPRHRNNDNKNLILGGPEVIPM